MWNVKYKYIHLVSTTSKNQSVLIIYHTFISVGSWSNIIYYKCKTIVSSYISYLHRDMILKSIEYIRCHQRIINNLSL